MPISKLDNTDHDALNVEEEHHLAALKNKLFPEGFSEDGFENALSEVFSKDKDLNLAKALEVMTLKFEGSLPNYIHDPDLEDGIAQTVIDCFFASFVPVGGFGFKTGIAELATKAAKGTVNSEFVQDAFKAMEPEDALETMLCSQMVQTHVLIMRVFAKMSDPSCTMEQFKIYENSLSKLQRTFALQMEALRKHRNKSTQIIKHVHVNDGGQAIVADNVTTGGAND